MLAACAYAIHILTPFSFLSQKFLQSYGEVELSGLGAGMLTS